MSQLEELLSRLHGHPGVQRLLLLGRDGLPIRQIGEGDRMAMDTEAALAPGVAAAAEQLGAATAQGRFATAVLEYDAGVVVLASLSADLLLAITLRRGVGFSELLRELRRERGRIEGLL